MTNSKFRYRLSLGLCTRCGVEKIREESTYLCNNCFEKEMKRQREVSQKRREKFRSLGLCTSCGKIKDKEKKLCDPCAEKARESSKKHRNKIDGREKFLEKRRNTAKERGGFWRKKRKMEVIEAYGGSCVCCGETEPVFLTIDHIHNNGNILRKVETTQIYAYLKRNGFPKDNYQLLCFNCNLGKHHNGGKCPHEKIINE